jgi:hypothetical protein
MKEWKDELGLESQGRWKSDASKPPAPLLPRQSGDVHYINIAA